MNEALSLIDHIWEWQMWTPDFGEAGQERLKGASVLVSRVGGVGSVIIALLWMRLFPALRNVEKLA